MRPPVAALSLGFLSAALAASIGTQPTNPTTGQERPDAPAAVRGWRDRISGFQWRLKTEIRVDDELRLLKVEDVSMAPDWGFTVRKNVRYERKPAPAPYPENDPRSRVYRPLSDKELDQLVDQANALLQTYIHTSLDRVRDWTSRASFGGEDPEHPGQVSSRAGAS